MYSRKPVPCSALKPTRKQPHVQSDADSIMTEDYENQFHTMMVKQVAKVPITNFDQMLIDSDLDTVKSQMIQDRIHSISKSGSVWGNGSCLGLLCGLLSR